MRKLLKDADLIKLLEQVDANLAEAMRAGKCVHCGARLHGGDFPRKPRGVESWDKRYSFDCSCCRKRHTPPSVRFLGRKVYAGIVVVLVSAMMHGPNAQRIDTLHEALGIDMRTLRRWHQWWLDVFVSTPFWKASRGRFMPVLNETLMPWCLVESFHAQGREGVIRLMRFIAPITNTSGQRMVAM